MLAKNPNPEKLFKKWHYSCYIVILFAPFLVCQNPIDPHTNPETLVKSTFFAIFPCFDVHDAIDKFAIEKLVMVALHGSAEKSATTDATSSSIIIMFTGWRTTNFTNST